MKNLLKKLFVGGVGMSLTIACSAESVDGEMITLNATTASTTASQDLTMDDLVGRWDMYSMTSVAYEMSDIQQIELAYKKA